MSVKAGVPYIHVGHRGTHSHTARRLNSALLDFNRKSAGHVESVSSLFVGVLLKKRKSLFKSEFRILIELGNGYLVNYRL